MVSLGVIWATKSYQIIFVIYFGAHTVYTFIQPQIETSVVQDKLFFFKFSTHHEPIVKKFNKIKILENEIKMPKSVSTL